MLFFVRVFSFLSHNRNEPRIEIGTCKVGSPPLISMTMLLWEKNVKDFGTLGWNRSRVL